MHIPRLNVPLKTLFSNKQQAEKRRSTSLLWMPIALAWIGAVVLFQKIGADFFNYLYLSSYFSFSWDFADSLDPLCFGARWIAAFYLSWFGFPYLGALQTTLVCGLGFVLCRKVIRQIVNKTKDDKLTNLASLVFSALFAIFLAWLLVRPINYFNVAFSILFMMGGFLLWSTITKPNKQLVFGIVILVLAYLGFGGYAYGLVLLMMIRTIGKMQTNASQGSLAKPATKLVLFLLTIALTPYLAHRFIYLRLPKDTYSAGLKPDTLFPKPPFKPWLFAETDRLFYHTHVLANKEEWMQIRDEVGNYFDRFDFEHLPVEGKNQDLLNYYKLATIITQSIGEEHYTKRLNNPLFATLFPNPIQGGDGTYSFFWSDFYYHLGAMADARFEAMMAMYSNGFSRRSIDRMYACNVILNDTAFAKTFNRKRTYPLYQNQTVAKQTLAKQKKLLAQSEYTNLPVPDLRIVALQQVAPNNPFAFEYVIFCALQYFRQHALVAQQLETFNRLGYTQLPTYFEEALLAARSGNSDPNNLLFPISRKTQTRYQNYTSDQNRMNQGLMPPKTFEEKYKNTYWFSFDYVEPQKIQ